MLEYRGKYFSRIFFGILFVLQFVLFLGSFSWTGLWLIQGFRSLIIFWTALVPLLPFALFGIDVFVPSGYPSFIGWVILVILQSIFALFISGMVSPLLEVFFTKKKEDKK
ncbi:MAG: hypothetical protein WCG73_03450 [Candidatus Moraniibacteriota bacterium]